MKSIVKGNDFTMRIPVVKMVDGEKVAFPLPGCTDVEVRVCNSFRRTTLAHEISAEEDNVLLCHVDGDLLGVGNYALEVKGKLFGASWRSNEYEQLRIVSNNASGDTSLGETDEGETSLLMDTAIVILPPDKVVSQLVGEAQEAISTANKALETAEATNQSITESEASRSSGEAAREANETARQSGEASRQEAETKREQAEAKRESDTKEAIERAKVSIAYNPDEGCIELEVRS